MTRPVSIVIPALDDPELLRGALAPLCAELAARAAGDEVWIVDDTGRDVLGPWLSAHHTAPPELAAAGARLFVLARRSNGGFAAAARSGVDAARHALVFLMNPDVRVRPGFLAPLAAALEDAAVFAATPRVLLDGRADCVESGAVLEWHRGAVRVREHGLVPGEPAPEGVARVPFAVGGALLARRADLLAGFDPMFEPFYWEDVDLCWSAARRGRRTVCVSASVVEHHHRGTIAPRVEPELVRAAIAKNELLFQWKHLDRTELAREHLVELYGRAFAALQSGERETLEALALALEQADELARARRAAAEGAGGGPSFRELCDAR